MSDIEKGNQRPTSTAAPEEVKKTPTQTEEKTETGYSEIGIRKLRSIQLTVVAQLLTGISWPIVVFSVFLILGLHLGDLLSALSTFMKDKQSVEITADAKGSFSVKIVESSVKTGIESQIKADDAKARELSQTEIEKAIVDGLDPSRFRVNGVDANVSLRDLISEAAKTLTAVGRDASKVTKVLWVDDHPQFNLGLQYAFQSLGLVVICVTDDDGIPGAFATAGQFDVVITDMNRDRSGNRDQDPEGGAKTVQYLDTNYPGTPVIIYAGQYARSHSKERARTPVIEVTDSAGTVFEEVVDIAINKMRGRK